MKILADFWLKREEHGKNIDCVNRQSPDVHETTYVSQVESATRKEQTISRTTAYVMLTLSYLFGASSLLLWMVFLFFGSLNIVNLGLNETAVLVLNACLCLAFFIQHSVMIRRSFRRWLAQFIREQYHGALHTIVAGAVLLILVIFWQESAHTLAASQGVFRWTLRTVFFLSAIGLFWTPRALRSFDMFGIGPILRYLRGRKPRPPRPFTVRGLYRWVRHPMYLFCLLMIWSHPDLSADRLLYNILWTAWIIVGTVFEERDLVAAFGKDYRDYQSKVPMLIPYRINLRLLAGR